MYKVIVTDPISASGLKALTEHDAFQVEQRVGLEPEVLAEVICDYDALIVRSQTQVTRDIIQAADRLKVIARAGVGVDNIDIDAATEKGIIVINAPAGNTIAATEHTLAMMLALARNIPQAYGSLTSGKWERKLFKGVELYQKTLGVVGMGRIGTEVAKRAKGFQMNILGYDPFLTEDRAKKLGIIKASLDEIAAQADFITVHTPLTPETRGLINAEYFEKTKKGVRFINCARGGIIDEQALVDAVNSGQVAGAAIDVFEHEPPENPGLTQNPKIIVTPHLGASTTEAQEKVAESVSEEIRDILTSGSVQHAINLPHISATVKQKIKPYLTLSEQMAELLMQIFKKAPKTIKINYYGELFLEDTGLLTRQMIKALLSYYLDSSINIVNVMQVLKAHGLSYSVQKNAAHKGFTNFIELEIGNGEDKATIACTNLSGFGGRIVSVNGYRLDMEPERYLLYIDHMDVPGMIGNVGSVLGKGKINIGSMYVGRETIGGKAVMVLTVDKPVPEAIRSDILRINDLNDVQFAEINIEESVD
ncbi:phosphoglycerate dehydrogenase [Sporolactobacillus inulinus]|uniref:D-3-phosphoglycerate dehydrogenase n=1 Tax=Sporolactobacillus inulinus CASD TaxID=1069536 RepID=A0A0U1QR32_9BACL|nr:phosphoglycerate dehydrogenase [Sporolactobacillus inulinus]KLI03261.1 D-3-phosphoglycerate dehydrogenase [Sporolactobacillus inulinus CASD]GEB76794.1 D-3-phosphoglycerate dehydrogenase [Sporolactobacillus inulinus]